MRLSPNTGYFPHSRFSFDRGGRKAGIWRWLRQLRFTWKKKMTCGKIRGELAYPSFVLVVAFGVVILVSRGAASCWTC